MASLRLLHRPIVKKDLGSLLFQELPDALGSLRRLKVLALDQNGIAAVPPAIFLGCDMLQTLSLHENPVTIEVRVRLCPLLCKCPAGC